jgi:hypothetical protein
VSKLRRERVGYRSTMLIYHLGNEQKVRWWQKFSDVVSPHRHDHHQRNRKPFDSVSCYNSCATPISCDSGCDLQLESLLSMKPWFPVLRPIFCNCVRYQVLTAANMKFRAFWDVAPCSHFMQYAPLKRRSTST